MQTQTQIELPSLPSALLRLALNDLEKCELDPRYRINMNFWHVPKQGAPCVICLAGSILAKTINLPINQECSVWDEEDQSITKDNKNKLSAVNQLRLGNIGIALAKLNLSRLEELLYFIDICPYEINSNQFKADLWKLVALLESHSL